ncbi:MAG: LarC family nickel insertion protein [Burkholderiales bacterium]|nr:LarC family nickel insertion protein [Burkholderiales bacterium]
MANETSDIKPVPAEDMNWFFDNDKHSHESSSENNSCKQQKVLTVRMHSGLAGDMFLCGLLRMLAYTQEQTNEILCGIFPKLTGTVRLTRKSVNNIGGWFCEVDLPHEHEHRNLKDVLDIISTAQMSEKAKELASKTFEIVAQAEGEVHSLPIDQVHFHEVGALDSILDICLTCELFARLAPDVLIVSPLPVADGQIKCAHGIIPCPAPAVQALLPNMQVRPFPALGETVTPTAVALLKALNPTFGNWPRMQIEKIDTVYGTYEYPGVPNGATFAFGTLI